MVKSLKSVRNKTKKVSTRLKTKKAAQKRYKVLGSGLVKVGCASKRHNTSKKTRALKNKLRKGKILGRESRDLVRECLPYSY
jgi:large subunit ribosomal protein L35